MNARSVVGNSLLLLLFAAAGIVALLILWGGHPGHALLKLSRAAILLTSACGVLAPFLIAWWYARESSAVTGGFALNELRKRNRGQWLLRGALATVVGSALLVLCAYLLVLRTATYLDGVPRHQKSTVLKAIVEHGDWGCHENLALQLDDGTRAGVCVGRLWPSDSDPPGMRCARPGDQVDVALRETVLGTVLQVVALEAPVSPDCQRGPPSS